MFVALFTPRGKMRTNCIPTKSRWTDFGRIGRWGMRPMSVVKSRAYSWAWSANRSRAISGSASSVATRSRSGAICRIPLAAVSPNSTA